MKLNKQWLAIPLMSAALVGCGDGGSEASEGRLDGDNASDNIFTGPGIPPDQQATFCGSGISQFAVVERNTSPADKATDVAINQSISITFNANVDGQMINDKVSLSVVSTGASSSVNTSTRVLGNTIVIDPQTDLVPATKYSLLLSRSLSGDCEDKNKPLSNDYKISFTTLGAKGSDPVDNNPPAVNASVPVSGESLAPVNTDIRIEFSETVDIDSFQLAGSSDVVDTASEQFNFEMIAVQANGDPLADAQPVLLSRKFDENNKNTIVFTPQEPLNPSEYYKVTLVGSDNIEPGGDNDRPAITDLAGNELVEDTVIQFRTGSLVVGLNDAVLDELPPLGNLLNELGGTALELLQIGDQDDGLDSVDDLVIIKLPLSQDLIDAVDQQDPLALQDLANEDSLTAFDTVLIAVCDPKSISTGTSNPDCVLSVDLGLDATQLAAALAASNVESIEDVPAFIAQAVTDDNDGLGIEIVALDDDSIFLPDQLEDLLTGILTASDAIPVLGQLVRQNDGSELLNVGILDGAIISVDAGEVVSVSILDADALSGGLVEGGSGLLTGSGALIDILGGAGPLLEGLCTIRLLCTTDSDEGPSDGESNISDPLIELRDAALGLVEIIEETDLAIGLESLATSLADVAHQLSLLSGSQLPEDISDLTSVLNDLTESFPAGDSLQLTDGLAQLALLLSDLPIGNTNELTDAMTSLSNLLTGIIPGF